MLKATSLIVKNARTFYDYRTGELAPSWSRYVAVLLAALLLSLSFSDRSDNLYLGIITAQSILAGFGFNVMISLALNRGIQTSKDLSIERAERIARVNLLGKELFSNVAYFNMIAVGSIVFSVTLLLVPALWSGLPAFTKAIVENITVRSKDLIWWLKVGESLLRRTSLFVLYALVIDSFATFIRTIERASYYFDARLKLDPAGP